MSEECERDAREDIITHEVPDEFCRDYETFGPDKAAAMDVARRWAALQPGRVCDPAKVVSINKATAVKLGLNDDANVDGCAIFMVVASVRSSEPPEMEGKGCLLILVPDAPFEARLPDHYDDGYGANVQRIIRAFRTALQWLKNTPILFAFVPDEAGDAEQTAEEASHAETPA